MVTVSQHPANLWAYLYGMCHPSLDLRPIDSIFPPDMTPDEYNKLMQGWMQESKFLAQTIALRRAGYEVPIASDGVEIVDFMAGSQAKGILQKGDIIKAVEGRNVNLAEEVVEYIQEREIGQKVKLTVQREATSREVEVLTTSNRDEPDKAALGVYVHTLNWHPLLPLEIKIETGPVIGPSAGMMFVLEILDRLLPESLTGGHKIAGTGTISIDERVGGIGGVKQKVLAAENSGIKYFLVPAENYAEALEAAAQIKIVPVQDLEEALIFLRDLPGVGRNTAYFQIQPELNHAAAVFRNSNIIQV